MKHLVRGLIVLSALFVLSLSLSIVATVTDEDAAAKLRFLDPAGQVAQALPAMDYLVSDDGKSIEGPICYLPNTVNFEPFRRRILFTNTMGSYLPFLVSLADLIGIKAQAKGFTQAPGATLEWNAEIIQPDWVYINQITETMLTTNPKCNDEITRESDNGRCVVRVDTIYRSAETKNVLAIQFQTECLATNSQHARLVPDLDHPSLPVRVKRFIGLISISYEPPPEKPQ